VIKFRVKKKKKKAEGYKQRFWRGWVEKSACMKRAAK